MVTMRSGLAGLARSVARRPRMNPVARADVAAPGCLMRGAETVVLRSYPRAQAARSAPWPSAQPESPTGAKSPVPASCS
jgi:hypothetical protein